MRSSRWIEVVGLIAIVVSLGFVGIEIQQNTAATESQALLDLNLAMNEIILLQAEEGELADIVRRGHSNPDDLSPTEYYRYEQVTLSVFNAIEAAFNFHENGLIDDDQFAGWQHASCAGLKAPGTRIVWARNSDSFSKKLNDVISTQCNLK